MQTILFIILSLKLLLRKTANIDSFKMCVVIDPKYKQFINIIFILEQCISCVWMVILIFHQINNAMEATQKLTIPRN